MIIVCFLLQARVLAETIVHSADNTEVKSEKLQVAGSVSDIIT